jgi:hypothetical protein
LTASPLRPDVHEAAARRFRAPLRLPTLLAAGIGYGVAVVWASWPLALHLGDAIIDPEASGFGLSTWSRIDLDLLVWILAWGAHALRHQPLHVFDANIFYPAPNTLVGSENLLGLQVVAAPVFWASDNAVLTYNVTVLATVWLAAMFAFVAVRAWTGTAAAAGVAGALFAFAPMVAANFVRLHMSAVPLLPLITLLVWRCATVPRRPTAIALAVATALQIAAGAYVAFALAAWLLVIAPAAIAEGARRGRSSLPLLAALLGGALLASPLALPYLRFRHVGGLPDVETGLRTVAATSPAVATAALWIPQQLTWLGCGLALVALVGRRKPARRLRWALLCGGTLGFVLACGTSLPGVFSTAMRVVPGFAAIRAPGRFFVLVILAGSLLAGIGASDVLAVAVRRLSIVTRRRTRRAWVTAGLLGLAVAVVVARVRAEPYRVAPVPEPGEWRAYRWLARHGDGGAVLELPVFHSALEFERLRATGKYMIGSTKHWLPLLNGYSGHWPASAFVVNALARRLPDRAAFDDLCTMVGVRWVVAHLDRLGSRRTAWQRGVRELPLREAARFGDTVVYETLETCGALEPHLRAELRGERRDRTLRDLPLTPLPAEALHGTLAADVPKTMVGGFLAPLTVEVRNDGAAPWPAQTSHAEGRVAVQVRWRVPGQDVKYADTVTPLGRDLAPGETARIEIPVVPPGRGPVELEIGLVQQGRGWFVDLGGEGARRFPVEVVGARAATAP